MMIGIAASCQVTSIDCWMVRRAKSLASIDKMRAKALASISYTDLL
jgi:hypothetical protein